MEISSELELSESCWANLPAGSVEGVGWSDELVVVGAFRTQGRLICVELLAQAVWLLGPKSGSVVPSQAGLERIRSFVRLGVDSSHSFAAWAGLSSF